MNRFTVIEYTPGYLPESDTPPEFDNLDDAVEYVNELAEELVEDGYKIIASSVDKHSLPYEVQVERFDTVAPDLGRRIEVVRSEPEFTEVHESLGELTEQEATPEEHGAGGGDPDEGWS